ncbi:MAG: Fic family protein [Leifsonia sp.]
MLKNIPQFAHADQLRAFEEGAAAIRAVELASSPIQGRFDYDHMKAIHRYLFQDVYVWAGEERVAPSDQMVKVGPNVVDFAVGDPNAPDVAYGYYPAPFIADAAAHQYDLLMKENLLQGLPPAQFVDRLAEHWGEINTIHSFREGNTRSQFVFFSQLAEHAGYRLHPEPFRQGGELREEFIAARFYNQATGQRSRLAEVLARAVEPIAKDRAHQQPAAVSPGRSVADGTRTSVRARIEDAVAGHRTAADGDVDVSGRARDDKGPRR